MNLTKLFLLAVACLSVECAYAKTPKILVLIIASDDQPVYVELKKIWREYMHNDPDHVEAYFIQGNQGLGEQTVLVDDTIWTKSPENVYPGMINKTIMSLEALADRLHEFDYVLRTNLSSFYVFPRLLNFLQNRPRTRFYCGSSIGNGNTSIGSGCGFIMSLDLVAMLLHARGSLVNNTSAEDDVLIGHFFNERRVGLVMHQRPTFYSWDDWNAQKDAIPSSAFHFRVKTSLNRLRDDINIQRQLLKMFYGTAS